MDQITASSTPADAPPGAGTPADGAEPAPEQSQPAPEQSPPAGAGDSATESPGFRSRGSARRRARFLRKARELAYRDLGGLVFNLHRFGARNDALVLAKLTTLGQIDAELRTLEDALQERKPITVLREAGITACARCAAIHSSQDSFCPSCGLAIGRRVELPADLRSGGSPPVASSTFAPAPPPPAAPAAPEQAPQQPPAPEPPVPPVPPASGPQPTDAAPSATAAPTPRAPVPPTRAAPASPAPASADEPTEIIRRDGGRT